ncbi:MAG: alcohol dehydrogenase [Actinobacteria bacterium HGW-Actinobacteria-4]|nr:MAG: alcohol dehydrogenase [Actinobacteria bacterium HGW-Actinobacteria-4]
MKAAIREAYGPPSVVHIAERDLPEPGDGQVRIRVKASSVNPYDWHMVRGEPSLLMRPQMGLHKPKDVRLGVDVAGIVDQVGPGVSELTVGDEVFGSALGAYAEYAVTGLADVAHKPASMSFEEAGAVGIAGYTAVQALRDWGGLVAGQTVLINGAAGGVGTFAVQIAKAMGAEVTGVCSARNVDLVASLGADHVIDYGREDYTRAVTKYDVVVDAVGNHRPRASLRALKPKGTLVMVGIETGKRIKPLGLMLRTIVVGRLVSQQITPGLAKWSRDDLEYIAGLVESGELRPVIDRTYPLAEAAAAIAHVEEGHARGKVVITV